MFYHLRLYALDLHFIDKAIEVLSLLHVSNVNLHLLHLPENKEYDVFLSLVWSSPSAQVQGNSTLSTRSEPLLGEGRLTCLTP